VSENEGAAHEEQYRQCTFNVILRRVRVSLLPWKAITHTRLYWCVLSFVRVPRRVRVWMRARVALLIQHPTRMCHIVSFVALVPPYFFDIVLYTA
jgi:hypothetical protein